MIGPPLVVTGCRTQALAASTALAAQGWRLRTGFASTASPPSHDESARIVYTGDVTDASGAGEALLAAVSGAGIVAVLDAPAEVAWRFLDDLARLGPVLDASAVAAGGDASDRSAIDDDARRLLERLAAGDTVTAAARAVGMSRRTTTRRLAEVRAALGVDSNAAAVMAVLRQGPPS